jgi:hypothetical protein
VFIGAVPITKLFAWGGGGGQWRTCATRDYEPRPVWTSLPITHSRVLSVREIFYTYQGERAANTGGRPSNDVDPLVRDSVKFI